MSSQDGLRQRRLRSIGVVAESAGEMPAVEDLGQLAALPERVAAKLEAAGFDAAALLDARRA